MKTPKPSTPAVKSKLNTPRSGFIKKGSESVKKMKLNVLNSEVSKSNNSTPKIDKSVISEKLLGNFASGKKDKSPKDNGLQSPGKNARKKALRKAAENNSETKAETSPKTGKQNSPTAKFKQNKTSPEAQLGLDIEQYLNKNTKQNNKSQQSTPTGKKQVGGSPKLSPSPTQKLTPPNQSVGKGKKRKRSSSQKAGSTNQTKKSGNNEDLVDKVTIKNAVQALLKYIDENPKEKNEMLGPNVPLLLQIDCIKETKSNRSRLLLPHTLVYENSDICLFISDKGKKGKDDELVEEMKERLKKNGVDCVTEILPWRKALHEHGQYEQKMKLMNRFDFFLIENKLARIKAGLTNKFVPRKWPIVVNLNPESKLKENIETALRKIPISFKGTGLTKAVQFGHSKMTVQHLVENLETIIRALCDEESFHLGRDNLRSLLIKTNKSTSFPLFISTKSSNLVASPPKQKKVKDEGVEGELSTFPDRTVKVFKDGTVKTQKIKNNEDNQSKKQNKKNKKEVSTQKKEKVLLKKEESEEEEESDDDEEDEDDSDDEDMSEDEDMSDDEEMSGDEDDDEDEDDEDYEEEDLSSGEEEELKDKLSRQLNKMMKNQKQNNKAKKRKQDSETDEDELEEAEQGFLKELRKQQDEIESQAKKGQAQKQPGKKFQPKNQMKKPNQQESNNLASKKGKGQQGFSQKNVKQSNMNANNLKKNDANTGISKNKAKKMQNKNKQNQNANHSPSFNNKKPNKTTPGGKKFGAKSK